MTITTKSRVGRKRWGELVRFLTSTMKTSGNERVRMAAAQRLTDILTLREQREQLEMRREIRDIGKAVDAPETDGQPEPSTDAPGRTRETDEEFLQRIAAIRAVKTEQEDQEEETDEDE